MLGETDSIGPSLLHFLAVTLGKKFKLTMSDHIRNMAILYTLCEVLMITCKSIREHVYNK